MDNTAYTENLNRIATKLAKEFYKVEFEHFPSSRPHYIDSMLPLAAICLEEMAEQYQQGYDNGWLNCRLKKVVPSEQGLINKGLTPTKTDSNG